MLPPIVRSACHPLHPLERAVLDSIRRELLFGPEAHVLVALSGGADSTALLAALSTLRREGALAALSACHVDHQLRPGGGVDAEFCARRCDELGVAFHRVKVQVPPSGIQAAARRERYRALALVADGCGADRIATAHTRSDQAETVLHRLLRGSGARGLAGIPVRRGRIVRPLLAVSRHEVVAYLRARGLSWRDDPSNESTRFLRNRLRREVLPLLEGLAPGLERRLARTATLLRGDDQLLDALARRLAPRGASSVPVEALAAAPLAVRRRAVRLLWRAATGARRDLGADHVEAVVRLLQRPEPRSILLPRGFTASVAYGTLELRTAPAVPSTREPTFAPLLVEGPGSYRVPGFGSIEVRWSSPDAPPWPIELRTRQPGDRFHPAGAPGGKKLKAWLIDRKVPRAIRDRLLVVTDGHGRVLHLPELGVRAAGAGALDVSVRRTDT